MGNRCAKIYGHTNAEANSVTTVTKIDLEKHVMAGNGNVVHFIIFGHEGKLDIAGESDVGVFVIQVKGEAYAFG